MKINLLNERSVPGKRGLLILGMITLGCLPGTAAVTSGTAESMDFDVNLTSLGILSFIVEPYTEVSIVSPTTGTVSDSQQSVSESQSMGEMGADGSGTGSGNAVWVEANSTVDGLSVTGAMSSLSTVSNLTLTVLQGMLVTPDLLSLSATTLSSQSTGSGGYGALSSVGSSVLEGLVINVAGVSVTIPINPAPNTSLDLSATGVGGLSIILNEQIESGDGLSESGITTNALHIVFDAVSFGGVDAINGDIVFAHTELAMLAAPVPEPSLVSLLALVPLFAFGRRRRSTARN